MQEACAGYKSENAEQDTCSRTSYERSGTIRKEGTLSLPVEVSEKIRNQPEIALTRLE